MAARSRARKTARPAEREPRPAAPQRSEDEVLRALAALSPAELYQLELKKRRATGGLSEGDERLAAAKREFEAMLAAEAGTPRGGRPRKKPEKKAPEDSVEDFEGLDAPPALDDEE